MPSDEGLAYSHTTAKGTEADMAKQIISDQNAQHTLFYVKDVKGPIQVFISKGNTKLGLLPNFNLPARSFILNGKRMVTCPGASLFCRQECYAQKGMFAMYYTIPLEYVTNYLASLRDDFVPTMIEQISIVEDNNIDEWRNTYGREPRVKLFRLHTSGDFYSPDYAHKWREIAERLTDVHFYVYTRAWVTFKNDEDVADIEMTAAEVNELNAKIMDELREINALPNFQILLSTDEKTGGVPEYLLKEGFKEAGIGKAFSHEEYGRPAPICAYQKTEDLHAGEIDERGVEKLIKEEKIVTDIPMDELMDAIREKRIRRLVEEGKIVTDIPAKKIAGEIRDTGMQVLIREGKIVTCDRCGYCWDKVMHKNQDVYFKLHRGVFPLLFSGLLRHWRWVFPCPRSSR